MAQVSVLDQTVTMSPITNSLKEAEIKAGESSIPIEIKVSSQGAYRIYDEFDAHMISKNADGSYTVSTNLPIGTWLDSYLMSFGTLIEEIHPVLLRERLVKKLDELKSNLEKS